MCHSSVKYTYLKSGRNEVRQIRKICQKIKMRLFAVFACFLIKDNVKSIINILYTIRDYV